MRMIIEGVTGEQTDQERGKKRRREGQTRWKIGEIVDMNVRVGNRLSDGDLGGGVGVTDFCLLAICALTWASTLVGS